MTEPTSTQLNTSRGKLLILIGIAFVPIFVAFLAFQYFPDWRPTGTTNQVELIMPPVSAEAVSQELIGVGGWVLLQPVNGDCDEYCKQMLYLSRQVVTGLGKDSSRVRRVLTVPVDVREDLQRHLRDEHGDIKVVPAEMLPLNRVSRETPLLFLMDPNGNIMMYYSLEKAGKPMLKDLKHLLRHSNIG